MPLVATPARVVLSSLNPMLRVDGMRAEAKVSLWLMVVCVSEEDGRLAEQHSLVELPAAAPSEHRDPRGSS